MCVCVCEPLVGHRALIVCCSCVSLSMVSGCLFASRLYLWLENESGGAQQSAKVISNTHTHTHSGSSTERARVQTADI